MPTYTYRCTENGCDRTVDRVRAIADRDAPLNVVCHKGDRACRFRRVLTPPLGIIGADSWRK